MNVKRRRKKQTTGFAVLILLIACLLSLVAILLSSGILNGGNKAKPAVVVSDRTSSEEESSESVKEPTSIRLMGVGDDLIHEAIYNQARQRAGGNGYDFNYAYKNIENIIQMADIASINQETVMADGFPLSAYPMFNSPTDLGRHLVNVVGFDVFNQATNHVLDKGEKGVIQTLEFWKTQPNAKVCGVYENEEDYNNIRTMTVNDITVSFIGLTEYTNGLSLPKNTDVVLLMLDQEDKIKERIEKAKEISDVVVVNAHWGVEYTHTPNQRQKEMAKKMIEWGADVILGHHPHVIQPVEYIERSDGTRGVCVYSLGNFISAQDRGARMLGGLLDVTFTKNYENNKTEITNVRFVPTVTHYDSGFRNVRTYLLDDYTEELAKSHGVRSKTPEFSLKYLNNIVNDVIDEQFLTSYK